MNIVSCALLDAELYEEVKREREERDRTCYQDYNGNYFCKDTKQEIIPAYKISRMNMKLW